MARAGESIELSPRSYSFVEEDEEGDVISIPTRLMQGESPLSPVVVLPEKGDATDVLAMVMPRRLDVY